LCRIDHDICSCITHSRKGVYCSTDVIFLTSLVSHCWSCETKAIILSSCGRSFSLSATLSSKRQSFAKWLRSFSVKWDMMDNNIRLKSKYHEDSVIFGIFLTLLYLFLSKNKDKIIWRWEIFALFLFFSIIITIFISSKTYDHKGSR